MASDIKLEIVTPEQLVLSKSVTDVILPSAEGYMGVKPGHAPLLAKLDVGEIIYRAEGGERVLAVSGGFAEVLPNLVSVLASTAEPAEEIDAERAEQSRGRAEQRRQQSEIDQARATASLKRALNRIHAYRRRVT